MSEVDYQKTLNLPQTDFSMKANLAQKEPGVLTQWEADQLYVKIRSKSKGKKTYTLHDGPPYANGNIHIGHALNKILKDIIVKAKTMQDFDSLYVPGWDCHGLPIEHQIFKDLKKRKSEVESVAFRKMAHDYAMKYVGLQREQFKRLGVFGEWENPYLTLSTEYEYWILNSFIRLVEKGYVYRGLKPVNWCGTCETALAEAEVEYEDHTSPSVYVKFEVKNPDVLKLPTNKKVYLLIWTTTPWTLLANVAVAVHHSYQYSFVDTGLEILIIESSLRTSVLEKAGVNGTVLKEVSGEQLKDLVYEHPFGIKANCRVITVDYVTKEDGTGLVHTAPGHGQEDFEAGRKNNLDILMPVNDQGVFTDEAGKFAGQYVFKANENIINDLKERGSLFLSQNIAHSYPHCWRCKKPILFRATKQWFLKIDHENLRAKLKDVIKQEVQWIPEGGRDRILGMVVTRPDWCLSRQRHWGVPIPALFCKSCGENRLYPAVMTQFADAVKKEGTDIWFAKDVKEFLPAGFKCDHCGKADFEKTFDILDVWFDSGVSHQAVIGPMLHQKLPADLYLEGSDQHRGWFQSSLIPGVALEDKAPYRAVLTHGFVVDGQGRKMSKSLGNVVSPDDVLKNYGADILRLWVVSSNYNDDIRLSKEILERLIDAYRKIRNTMRYLLGNLNGFQPDQDIVADLDLLEVDHWALYRLSFVLNIVRKAYEAYDFSKVYHAIYSFCNDDLSGFYLDILKDRLYTSQAKSLERRSAQTVLYHILDHLTRLLAPVLAFTCDEIFAAMPKDAGMKAAGNIHLLNWLDVPEQWQDAAAVEIEEKYKLLLQLRPFVMKALEDKRKVNEIGSPLEAALVFRSASERDLKYLEGFKPQLASLFIVSQVRVEQVAEVKVGLSDVFPKTEIMIERAKGEKCSRCWNYSVHIGQDSQHPALCERCGPVVRKILGELTPNH